MLCVVIDSVRSCNRFSRRDLVVAGIEISVETRKIAAADFEPEPVAFAKYVAGRPQIHDELVDLARVHQLRLLAGIAIARPYNSFGQILREAVGPHVHELGGEVGIYGGGI